METPAHERVRQRIAEFVKTQGHGSKLALAKDVPTGPLGTSRSSQWLSDVLAKRQPVALDDLDYIAQHMRVAPGWLVRGHDRNYEECTMAETKLLSHFRRMPDTVRHAALLCLDYFFSLQEAKQAKDDQRRKVQTMTARKHEHEHARKRRHA